MSTAQTWDPASYARNARFVSDFGSPVVELLAPQPGERILDLGCGDGELTKKLVELGCEVVAVHHHFEGRLARRYVRWNKLRDAWRGGFDLLLAAGKHHSQRAYQ